VSWHLEADPALASARASHARDLRVIPGRAAPPRPENLTFCAGYDSDDVGLEGWKRRVAFDKGEEMAVALGPAGPTRHRTLKARVVHKPLAADATALPGDGQEAGRIRGVVDAEVGVDAGHRRPAGIAAQPVGVQARTGIGSRIGCCVGARVERIVHARVTSRVDTRVASNVCARVEPSISACVAWHLVRGAASRERCQEERACGSQKHRRKSRARKSRSSPCP